MSDNYKILIVEDEVLIAEDLHDVLIDLGYDVAGICYDSESALDAIYRGRPDMVLLDINIRGTRDGIEVAEIINEKYQIPFVYLSSLSDRDTLSRAKVTRPRGYLVKPFKDRDLMTTIETAIFNHTSDLKQKELSIDYVNSYAHSPLSEKEYDVLMDIVDGLNNRQIAERHYVSVNTIKTHVKRIFSKLDVHDRLSVVKKITV